MIVRTFAMLVLTLAGSNAQNAGAEQNSSHLQTFASQLNTEFATEAGLQTVHAEMADGALHLRGRVALLEDERQALKKANNGSLMVVSHIIVQTATIPDGQLRAQLQRNLNRGKLDALQVRVRHGIVTLEGKVTDDEQRESALTAICSTPGVKGINDKIQVVSQIEVAK